MRPAVRLAKFQHRAVIFQINRRILQGAVTEHNSALLAVVSTTAKGHCEED